METIRDFKNKLESKIIRNCPYYQEIDNCTIGVKEQLFSGGALSCSCSKNPNCIYRKYYLEKYRRLAAQEMVSSLIKKNKKCHELRMQEIKDRKKFLKGRTYAEVEFGRILTRMRLLLDEMQNIQNKYDKGTKEYLVAKTVIIIIKRTLGLYARKVEISEMV